MQFKESSITMYTRALSKPKALCIRVIIWWFFGGGVGGGGAVAYGVGLL
jgi:hypothetical protein